MKYTIEIELDLPRDRVIELFDSSENLYKWQEGLQSFDHASGEPGQPGAISNLVFQIGKRRIEMTETITERNLPDEFNGTYDCKGCHNIVKNRFIELGSDKTKWESENVFRFSGIMRFIAPLMKGVFRKQSMKYLRAFKAFAEEGVDVNAATSE